jgi:hypothetical protein
LVCFRNNGNKPLLSKTVVYFDNSHSCIVSVGDVNNSGNKICLSPNPISSSVKITFPYKILSGSLSIYDFTGRKIFSEEFHQKETLHLGHLSLSPGIYFLQVWDFANGNVYKEKIIQE